MAWRNGDGGAAAVAEHAHGAWRRRARRRRLGPATPTVGGAAGSVPRQRIPPPLCRGAAGYGGATGDDGAARAEWAAARDRGATGDGGGGAAEWGGPTAARCGEAATARSGVGIFSPTREASEAKFFREGSKRSVKPHLTGWTPASKRFCCTNVEA
jgi:hypothetical protein